MSSSLFPTVKASEDEDPVEEVEEDDDDDEEVEDPQDGLREEVQGACAKYQAELDACTARVSAKSNTTETCEQELYDFLHCRDCKVAKTLFSKLK